MAGSRNIQRSNDYSGNRTIIWAFATGEYLLSLLEEKPVRSVFLQGLLGSSVPMFFAPLQEKMDRTVLFVLNDADEAGYFYHDLTQMMGQENAFFFPSSYRRAIKYGQRDAASEILRTEVLARLSSESSSASGGIYIVSYPAALAEW